MKPLITAREIRNAVNAGKKVIYLEPGTLVTPSAKDACDESGISISFESKPPEILLCKEVLPTEVPKTEMISSELISKIVCEVMNSMLEPAPTQMEKKVDSSGVCVIKGSTAVCEVFETGNPKDKVGLIEILNRQESPNMATGFMTMDHSAFDWHLMYDEVDYVVEGTLDIIINGKTCRGHAGDVLYIPRDTKVTFSTPDTCRFFFVTYPANWADLSPEIKK